MLTRIGIRVMNRNKLPYLLLMETGMKKLIISNAFSVLMLNRENQSAEKPMNLSNNTPRIPRSIQEPRTLVEIARASGTEIVSGVRHKNSAAIIGKVLCMDLQPSKEKISLDDPETVMLIAAYDGPRMSDDATEMPEGGSLQWWKI